MTTKAEAIKKILTSPISPRIKAMMIKRIMLSRGTKERVTPQKVTTPSSDSGEPPKVIQETVTESEKQRTIPIFDPSLHGAGVTAVQHDMKTLPSGFETLPSAYPGTTATFEELRKTKPPSRGLITDTMPEESEPPSFFRGGKDERGVDIAIRETPYKHDFDFMPSDPDYRTIEKKLGSMIRTDEQDISDVVSQSKKAEENIPLIKESMDIVRRSPPSAQFIINDEPYSHYDALSILKYHLGVSEKALAESGGVIAGIQMHVGDVGETLKTVRAYKQAGYTVDVEDIPSGGESYTFGLPSAIDVHKKVTGGGLVEGVSLATAGLLSSPFGIETLKDVGKSIVTGDPKYRQERLEQTAEYSLGLQKGLDDSSYFGHVMLSPAMVSGAYIPALTIGAGYAVSGATHGFSQAVSGMSGKISPIIQKFSPAGQQIIRKASEVGVIASKPLIMSGKAAGYALSTRPGQAVMLGGLYTAIESPRIISALMDDPRTLPFELAESGFHWGMAVGGFKLGARAYAAEYPIHHSIGKTKGSLHKIFYEHGGDYRSDIYLGRQSLGDIPSQRFKTGLGNIYSRIKSYVFEPSSFELRQTYGLTGTDRMDVLISGRSPYGASQDIATLEQIMGKRPDPFTSYAPSKWGGYDTSWSFYRESLIGEPLKRIPQKFEVPYTIYDGKTVMFKGKFVDKKPLEILSLADAKKSISALPSVDDEIVDVGFNIRTRFGYPTFESQKKPSVSIKSDYPLFESQVKYTKKFSDVPIGIDTSHMPSKNIFKYLSKPLDKGVVVELGQPSLKIVYKSAGKVSTVVTHPRSTGIPYAWKGIYDVPVTSMVHGDKWLLSVLNVATATSALQKRQQEKFLDVVSVPSVKSVFDYRVKVDTIKKSRRGFELKQFPLLDLGSLSSSMLASVSMSAQMQDTMQKQSLKTALVVSSITKTKLRNVQETASITTGGGEYVFEPPVFTFTPFAFDVGDSYSFEGFDDFIDKPVKGRKYRRKTHPVELIRGIL